MIINYINRKKSIITRSKTLERLYTYKKFPIYIGCTNQEYSKDLLSNMDFMICKESGIIQLEKLLPLELVYQTFHSEAVKGIWKEHHQSFAKSYCLYKRLYTPSHKEFL